MPDLVDAPVETLSQPYSIGQSERLNSYFVDLRESPPDVFEDLSATDWSRLRWKDIGRPYRVERWAKGRREWEEEHGAPMPVKEGWERFNRSFHHFFITDLPRDQARARREIVKKLARMDVHGARETMEELLCLAVWNRVHRVEDAVWDPRGKRALFGVST